MNETYKHHYLSTTTYRVYEYDELGIGTRFIDDPNNYKPYQDWIAAGNIPEKKSGARFISIVNDEVVVDPNKELILAAEKKDKETQENDKRLRDEIAAIDWKILRYIGQEKLVAKGKLAKTKQTEAEFVALLEYQQSLRDQVSDPKIDVSIGE